MNNLVACVGFGTLLLCGCQSTSSEYSNSKLGTDPVLLTTADVRIISQRPSPSGGSSQVVCSEPSPDVAKALQTSLTASANATAPSGISAGGTLNAAEAQQLAQLTARVPSIQALRDGLSGACEAYANGSIGANAYSVILSRYGDLLVTLILSEAAAGNAATTLQTLQGLNMIQPLPSNGAGNQQKKPTEQPTTSPTRAAPASSIPRIIQASLLLPSSSQGLSTPAASAQDLHLVVDPNGGNADTSTPTPASTATGSAATASASTAQIIESMQLNYFDQTLGKIGPMFVMCANVLDPTRPHTPNERDSAELNAVCMHLVKGLERQAVRDAALLPAFKICEAALSPTRTSGTNDSPTSPISVACANLVKQLADQSAPSS
jgi:hypothetical protein